MKTHAVIMTFPADKFEQYGYCIKGFSENWPENVMGYAIVEGAETVRNFERSNLKILEFDDCVGEEILKFEQRNTGKNIFDLEIGGDITRQAAKFARKAFAQIYVLETIDVDFVHYIDADLYTHKDFPIEEIENITNKDFLVACTPRWWKRGAAPFQALDNNTLHVGYTETGYMIWNRRHSDFKTWLKLYKSCYEEDKIFNFEQWHDCIAFDFATLTCMSNHASYIFDLSFGARSSHPLVVGPLGKYFDHMKGPRKFIGASPERIMAHGTLSQKVFAIFNKIAFKIFKNA